MHTLIRLRKFTVLGMLLGLGAIVTLLASASVVRASGESYTWLDSSNIQASGGDFVGTSVIGEFQPFQDTSEQKFVYSAPFDILVNSEPYQCRITGTAEFTEPNNLKLVIYTGASAGTSDQAPRCSISDEYVIDGEPVTSLYNNKTFTTKSSRPGSGGDSTPETAAQKVVTTYVCNYKANPPKSVKLTLKDAKGEVVKTLSGNGSKKDDCQMLYQPSFKNVKPGEYTMCSNLSKECDTFTKIRYKPTTAALYVGNPPESDKNKVVEGSLYIDNPDLDLGSLDQNQSFGTYPIVLLDSSGKKIDKISVDVAYDMAELCKDYQEKGEPCTVPKTVSGYISFDNVPPGKYKVCIENTEKCHSFTKKRGERYRDANIHLSMDEATEYDTSGTLGGPGDGETTCAVDGIGWIVCPVVTFLSKLNDAAFGFLNDFLNVPPDVFSDPATKQAWEAFRNIANIAFVIAFLVIIYSQMTGAGVSNYGLKKLLPKLIIAAILVNVSYYICAIAVDISNILGGSLYDLIKGINIGDDAGAGGAGSDLWAKAGAVILAGTAVVGLLALIIFAPMSLVAFALVIMILIARQAFVVLLIVISPLAFVAYLLPNTDQWFKKWWKALVTILMVFPIIAVVFGASSLASDILIRVSEDGAGGGDDNQLMKIVGAAVLAIPLFAVPHLLKGALSAAGSIGAKVAGLQGGLNKASGRRMKEGVARQGKSLEARMASAEGNGMRARAARRLGGYRTRRDFRRKSADTAASQLQEEALAQHITDNADRYSDRDRASAIAARQKISGERIANSMALLQDGNPEDLINRAVAQLQHANANGDVESARAATQILTQKTGSRGIQQFHEAIRDIEANGGLHGEVSEGIRSDVSSAGLKGKDRALDTWSRFEGGRESLAEHDDHMGTARGLNEAELAGQSVPQLTNFAQNGSMTQEQAQRVLAAHTRGTIHLDDAKLAVFNERANSTQVRDIEEAHDQALQEEAARNNGQTP